MVCVFRFGNKLEHLCSEPSIASLFHFTLYQLNPFWLHLFYFNLLSLLGFLTLKLTGPRTTNTFRPHDLDLFFTSVSASTVSSMSTVEMEVFSNAQLLILTLLMFLGGEVFISMLGLQFRRFKLKKPQTSSPTLDQIELPITNQKPSTNVTELPLSLGGQIYYSGNNNNNNNQKYNSIRSLCSVVLAYLLVNLVIGSSLVSLYITLIPSASRVLHKKGIPIQIFSVFTTVSTFTNCGFTPNNENMMVFKHNSGLLLILIPQILLGNTLYPFCLRMVIWILERLNKRVEYGFILRNYDELGYGSLMSSMHSPLLAMTAVGLMLLQAVLFCMMEWSSKAMEGLNSYQKLVGSLFQAANSRHAGESIVDLSILSPAILVLFVVMMYLPPYTTFIPIGHREETSANGNQDGKKGGKSVAENFKFSQLSYLVIFVALICMTERDKLKADPLNFNVFNIVVEVISAYGNVGLTMGYSCDRRMNVKLDENCKDAWYGFAGHWSNKGKLVLIFVMFFGRLKKFNMRGGKSWHLL
ncbi:hypothetical protein Ancab_017730 [Ancistrocladus abbreviatus]